MSPERLAPRAGEPARGGNPRRRRQPRPPSRLARRCCYRSSCRSGRRPDHRPDVVPAGPRRLQVKLVRLGVLVAADHPAGARRRRSGGRAACGIVGLAHLDELKTRGQRKRRREVEGRARRGGGGSARCSPPRGTADRRRAQRPPVRASHEHRPRSPHRRGGQGDAQAEGNDEPQAPPHVPIISSCRPKSSLEPGRRRVTIAT